MHFNGTTSFLNEFRIIIKQSNQSVKSIIKIIPTSCHPQRQTTCRAENGPVVWSFRLQAKNKKDWNEGDSTHCRVASRRVASRHTRPRLYDWIHTRLYSVRRYTTKSSCRTARCAMVLPYWRYPNRTANQSIRETARIRNYNFFASYSGYVIVPYVVFVL